MVLVRLDMRAQFSHNRITVGDLLVICAIAIRRDICQIEFESAPVAKEG